MRWRNEVRRVEMERYELMWLIGEFGKHEMENEAHKKKFVDDFREIYPTEPLPKHLADEFSLPTALSTLVMEIIELRSEIDLLKARK